MATLTHLVLLKEDFAGAAGLPEALRVRTEIPTYSGFLERVAKVGDEWHLRPELRRPSLETLAAVKDGDLYIFERASAEIGFCYVSFEGAEIRQTGLASCVEINKVGLYPGHTGGGLGRSLVGYVLSDLFKMGAEAVCLNTRDSNHVNSVPFYERMGFQVTGSEPVCEQVPVPALVNG